MGFKVNPDLRRLWLPTSAGIAYASAGWLASSGLDLGSQAPLLWFPAGIALAAFLRWGGRLWWGIWVGDLGLRLGLGVPLGLAVGAASASTAAAWGGARGLRRAGFSPSLPGLGDAIAFLWLGATLAPALYATGAASLAVLLEQLPLQEGWPYWRLLWLGSFSGTVLLAPLLFRFEGRAQLWQVAAGTACLGLLAGVGGLAFPGEGQPGASLAAFAALLAATALLLSAATSERQAVRAARERDRRLREASERIRQSLALAEISQTAVVEVRSLLQADRAYLSTLDGQGAARVVAESVAPGYPALLGWDPPQVGAGSLSALFAPAEAAIAEDTARLKLPPGLRRTYRQFQVRAALTVPLPGEGRAAGCLGVHQCSGPRPWQEGEVELLERLASQVAAALEQARRYRDLERQLQERTSELEAKQRELAQLSEVRTLFLQAVAHDLRTSTVGLLVLLKHLQARPGDPIVLSRSLLDRIVDSSDRQLALMTALSEGQGPEQPSLTLHCRPLSLSGVVRGVVRDWQPKFRQNQARLTYFIPEGLPPIQADPEQLRRVFDHLLTNVLKHNPPATNLTVRAEREGRGVRCTLMDDGTGMEPQQCQQLFKLYVRNFHNQRLTGIGLGCYQCRQIIEAHGGQIGVRSTPGVGSQFWFTLPLASPESESG